MFIWRPCFSHPRKKRTQKIEEVQNKSGIIMFNVSHDNKGTSGENKLFFFWESGENYAKNIFQVELQTSFHSSQEVFNKFMEQGSETTLTRPKQCKSRINSNQSKNVKKKDK